MASVHQDHFQHPFQDVEHRSPINPGTLDSHVGTPFTDQPVRQNQQVIGHGGEGTGLFLTMFNQAGNHRLGMYIQAATARVNNLHCFLLWSQRENLASKETVMRASASAERQMVVPKQVPWSR